MLTKTQIKNIQTEKERIENWDLWCKNSEEENRHENDSEENDFLIYYNWYAAE